MLTQLPSSPPPVTSSQPTPDARPASTGSREAAAVSLAVWAVGIVVLRALDDAFLQPAAGLTATDHLLSGSIPVVLGVAAAVVVRSRHARLRALTTLISGLWGLVGSMELFIESGPVRGGFQTDDVSGVLSFAAGAVLICAFFYFTGISPSPSRRRTVRVLRRSATAAGSLVLATVVVFPLGLGYMATHYTGPGITQPPDLGVPVERVRFESSDGMTLTGWYAATSNGAVVVILPGRTGVDEARMLASNGYGVLLVNRRGEGDSEGDPNLFGWGGGQDVAGAVRYLRETVGIAPEAIGGLGLSVGGEILLQHAAQSRDLASVVVEGSGSRSIKESLELKGGIRIAELTTAPLLTSGLVVLTDQATPPNLVDMAKDLAPTRALFIWGEDGQQAEPILGKKYVDAAGDAASFWEVPDAGHIAGFATAPRAYERRVVGFFDSTLLTQANP